MNQLSFIDAFGKAIQFVILFTVLLHPIIAQDMKNPITPFELNPEYSANYEEAINYYRILAEMSPLLNIVEVGDTDSGLPLHTVVLSGDQDFDPDSNHNNSKTILFINNAIHPGEPCGVDASMMFARDIALTEKGQDYLKNITIVLVPFYNIGGVLNRGSYSRANQVGPLEYGFRGNSKNLDLNRDFIKCDSKNAQTFNQIFSKWNPHVFIDNHTSNGADYQYTLTLIATQKDKLAQPLRNVLVNDMIPYLYAEMEKKNWEMTPYVYAQDIPDNGIMGFNETPRYSTGYACLHQCIGFMPETHMLKPYAHRVNSVYAFMQTTLDFIQENKNNLLKAKKEATLDYADKKSLPLEWELVKNQVDKIKFKGYEASTIKSELTGQDRLFYDRDKPFQKDIDYLNTYSVKQELDKPDYYIIPQAYTGVIQRLEWNGVEMEKLTEDTNIECNMLYIDDYSSVPKAYESHFLHYGIQTNTVKMNRTFRKGDVRINMRQPKDRYIFEVLEPTAPDSYFAWNFFDGILMQKEYFSAYVFEDLALEILKEDPELKTEFENKKKTDEAFAADGSAQLGFIYKRSKHYESSYLLYPIGRVFE